MITEEEEMRAIEEKQVGGRGSRSTSRSAGERSEAGGEPGS